MGMRLDVPEGGGPTANSLDKSITFLDGISWRLWCSNWSLCVLAQIIVHLIRSKLAQNASARVCKRSLFT